MIKTLYQVRLTATEARLCRDAAKAADETLYLAAGQQTLEKGQWLDVAKWLDWRACDLECRLELSTRKACGALAVKIEFALASDGIEVDVPEQVPAGSLF